MKDLEEYGSLIDAIYEGATDAKAWPIILDRIANWLGVSKALLFTPLVRLEAGGFADSVGLSQACIMEWAAPDAPEDMWAKRIIERGLMDEGRVILGQEVVPEAELIRDPWYTRFLARHNLGRLMTSIVFGLNQKRTPLTSMSFYRSLEDACFSEFDRRKLQLILPHVSRALGVLMTLRDAEFKIAASLEALNRINTGVLLFDESGNLCFANKTGSRILAREDGIRTIHVQEDCVVAKSRIVVKDPLCRTQVDSAIKAALDRDVDVMHFHQAVLVPRTSSNKPYVLQISALSMNNCAFTQTLGETPRAIGFLSDSEQYINIDVDILMSLYKLTPAEARVAKEWVECESAVDIANFLDISPNTLKTQVRQIYQKMGVDSRAAFVRLILAHASTSLV